MKACSWFCTRTHFFQFTAYIEFDEIISVSKHFSPKVRMQFAQIELGSINGFGQFTFFTHYIGLKNLQFKFDSNSIEMWFSTTFDSLHKFYRTEKALQMEAPSLCNRPWRDIVYTVSIFIKVINVVGVFVSIVQRQLCNENEFVQNMETQKHFIEHPSIIRNFGVFIA